MAERNRESHCGDATSSGGGSFNTVFIDTDLNTHLAMIVSDSDTVLHLKKKITSEHPLCFPELGKIKINALKVKRKGVFYHLSDSMLVRSAFEGAKKCWFLSIDVSCLEPNTKNQMLNKSVDTNELALIRVTKTNSGDSSNHLANSSSKKIFENCGPSNSHNEAQKILEMEAKSVAVDHCSQVFSDFNEGLDNTSKTQEQPSERNVVSEISGKQKGGDSQVIVNDEKCNNPPEGSIRAEPVVTKKRKSRKKDKTKVSNLTVKNDVLEINEHSSDKKFPPTPKDTEMENVNACNIVSEENGNHKNDYSQVGIDPQCNDPLKGSLRRGTGTNKKEKSKKNKDLASNCTLKFDDADIDKHSSDKKVREVPVDVEMVNIDAVKAKSLVNDAPSEDASNSISASRKRKREKIKQAGSIQEEDNRRTPMKNDIVRKSSVVVKQKENAAFTENLIAKHPEDVDTSSKKSRKKKRIPKDQEVFVVPHSQNAGEESCKENAETVAMNISKENTEHLANNIDKATDSAIVSESNVQLARPYSVADKDVVEHDVATAVVRTVLSKIGTEIGSKVIKKSKKGHSSILNQTPPSAVTELGNIKDDNILSAGEGLVRDDHNFKIDGSDQVKEQKKNSHNNEIKKMVSEKCENPIPGGVEGEPKEANINLEAGNSGGTKRVKKRAKKPISEKPGISSAEYSDNYASDFSVTASHDLNNEAKKMRSPLSQTKIAKLTALDASLVDANGEGNNNLSKGGKESSENEEFVQKNYGKEGDMNSHVKEKKTKVDFPQQKITSKKTGVSAAKPRNKLNRSEEESQEQKKSEKVAEINTQVKGKERKMDFPPEKINDINPTEVSASKPRKKMKKTQKSTDETQSALPVKEQERGIEELISSKDGDREVENASRTEKLGKSNLKNQLTGKDLENKNDVGDGHDVLATDLTRAPSSVTYTNNIIDKSLDYVDGDVLHNPNVRDLNGKVEVSKSKDNGVNLKEFFSPRDPNRESPPVETVVNVVPKLKSSDTALKAKKSTQVSLENGTEKKTRTKNSTDIEQKDARISTLKAKKENERKVVLQKKSSPVVEPSGKRIGEIVNSSQREKSLLATSGPIFSDKGSDEGSDSSGVSDTSTKVPSNYSEEESDSEEERADSARGGDNGRHNSEPKTPHSKRIDMETILRCSSRFKEAKILAKSQLEDTESQPVDFVPDSQPNH